MLPLNPFDTTSITLASSAYTIYKLHPYVPYSFLWHNAVVPGTFLVLKTLKNQITGLDHGGVDDDIDPSVEMYEVISHDETMGIVTKIIIFEEPQFTLLGTEYVDDDDDEGPVFL
jgi:hypothetical protein